MAGWMLGIGLADFHVLWVVISEDVGVWMAGWDSFRGVGGIESLLYITILPSIYTPHPSVSPTIMSHTLPPSLAPDPTIFQNH